jgi:hypothetical protein
MLFPIVISAIALIIYLPMREIIQLELSDWQNPQFYAFGVFVLLGNIFSVKSYKNILEYNRIRAVVVPTIILLISATTIVLFFIL